MTEEHARPAKPRKTGYLPSLDGWRAVAVIGVMMTHDRSWAFFGHSLSTVMGYGGFGVSLFFAISGFLITTRILEEEKICGHFDIRRFYIRRIFRIQPAALSYLAAAALLMIVGLSQDSWRSWLAALFVYNNFIFHANTVPVITGHFWTLAVEEHFYILLSLTLLMVKKHRTLALMVVYLAFTLPPAFSYGIRHGWYDPSYAPLSTQWQLTSLLLAAVLASLLRHAGVLRVVKMVLRPWVAFVATPLLMEGRSIFRQLHGHRWPPNLADLSRELPFMATYVFVLWILSTVFHPHSLTTQVLETRPLRFIGRISYSLYLWHVMVFHFWSMLFVPSTAPLAFVVQKGGFLFVLENVVKYALVLGAATMSYYFIEKPMIRKGHMLAPPATPGRPELADLPVEQPRVHAAAVETAS